MGQRPGGHRSSASAAFRKAGFGLGVPPLSPARRRCGPGPAVGVWRQARSQRGRAGSGGRCYRCSARDAGCSPGDQTLQASL